ncbi:MAG: phosphatase PAP2 family protein [Anaerolineae bacterium]|nr:phosphatase PAP2 family protein [Anaerolineae bacterium]
MIDWLRRLNGLDRSLSERLTLPLTSPWRWLPAAGAHLGDGLFWLAVGGFLLAFGAPFIRGITLNALAAVLLSNGLSTLVKYTVRRRRPQELTQFYTSKHDRYSFPSGHATRMAAIAVIVSAWAPPLTLPAWALALLVALCRVLVGVHYLSDVIAGLAIGAAGATVVLRIAL